MVQFPSFPAVFLSFGFGVPLWQILDPPLVTFITFPTESFVADWVTSAGVDSLGWPISQIDLCATPAEPLVCQNGGWTSRLPDEAADRRSILRACSHQTKANKKIKEPKKIKNNSKYLRQECIPVGCVPSAAVAVGCVCPGGCVFQHALGKGSVCPKGPIPKSGFLAIAVLAKEMGYLPIP